MPEGDTVWRTARTLDAVLSGKAVTAFASSLPAVEAAARRLGLVGRVIERVEARGKHLLLRFVGGPVLHTHQGMRGRWHVQPAGSPGRRPVRRARAVIETTAAIAVCLRSPVVEILSPRAAASHPSLTRLGPDLLAEGFAPVVARERLRVRGELEIGAALMDQTALAGIGNVYKSEVLFLCGVSPFARVDDLDDVTLDRLVARAADLMRRNLGPGLRRTTTALSPTRHWVYRRAGEACCRCGTTIRRTVQGEQARSTYHCPACQRARPDPARGHP